jgi:hypothetical protein
MGSKDFYDFCVNAIACAVLASEDIGEILR